MKDEHLRIGKSHELLVTVCFDRCWSRIFPWVTRIRIATEEEDRQGKDIIVETVNVGDIPIQVKSSRKFLTKHFRRYPDIPVLIVNRWHAEEDVRKMLAHIIKKERAKRDPGYDRGSEFIPPRGEAGRTADPLKVSLADVARRR